MEKMLAMLHSMESIYPMSDGLKEHLARIVKFTTCKKEEWLLNAGVVCDKIYFIVSGLIRGYYVLNGQEVSSQFMKEGEVVTSIVSFHTQTVGGEYLVALEDSELFYITYEELQTIYRDFSEFNFISRVLTIRYWMLSQKQLEVIRRQSSRERYALLEHHFMDLLLRVPFKYLASYVDMDPATLSRARAN